MNINVKELSKDALRKEFAKNPNEYYKVALFDKEGFTRHTCKFCAKNFWATKEKESCGDSSHTPYSFFKEKPNPVKYVNFWKDFADFFKKNGHEEVEKYPVVSRWRQDLIFHDCRHTGLSEDREREDELRVFCKSSHRSSDMPEI